MPGNFLNGDTDAIYHLASVTRANSESLNGTATGLNSQLESNLRGGWLGAGSNQFFTGHGAWLTSNQRQVVNVLDELSVKKQNGAARYEYTDFDANSTLAGVQPFSSIGGAINPTS